MTYEEEFSDREGAYENPIVNDTQTPASQSDAFFK